MTKAPSLQEALESAGDAIHLLWHPHSPAPRVPVVKPEFIGFGEEQRSWEEGVALLDLCHHMPDLFIEGRDAVSLLSRVSANNFETFAVGQAKQFITVSPQGHFIQDGILARLGENRFHLIGIGVAHNWVMYHAHANNFDVALQFDPTSDFRGGAAPVLFRYQIQGPEAQGLLNELFGRQLDDIAFFRLKEVELNGNRFTALRHGMAGQIGFEFFGPWALNAAVQARFIEAGKAFGLVQVGGLAYFSAGVDSGWLATPVPAVYTSPQMDGFRRFVSVFSFEGKHPLHGSFYSPNIEDYYCSPYELGYGRSISFNHDFIGREALMATREKVTRAKVTLVWNRGDFHRIFTKKHGFFLSYTKDRVEAAGKRVGLSQYATYMAPSDEVHSLTLIDKAYAEPGTEVTLIWGQHPGHTAKPGDPAPVFEEIRCTVQPAPINEHARTTYRGK